MGDANLIAFRRSGAALVGQRSNLVELAVKQFAEQTANLLGPGEQARREWDSNPRNPLGARQFSRLLPSSARPSLRI